MALAGVLPADAQTTFSYRFSSCASGVSMQIVFPVTSTVGPVTTNAGAHGFIYTAISATFSLTIGGATQVFNGLSAASANYTPPTGPLAPALTTVGFDPSAGQGGPSWYVSLQGGGDLLPNGLTQTLPPLSAWALPNAPSNVAMHYDYITVSGQFYYIDTFGACSSSGAPMSQAGKGLGDPSSTPGGCDCGDPISIGNGNLFEQVADYQTSGANKLGLIRYYNSLGGANTFATTLGTNWRSNYDRYLRIVSASSVIAERPDGQQVSFTSTGGAWTNDTDVDLKLTNSGATWTLTDPHDTVETYSASGATEALLQSIRARNGYTQNLQYSAGNQPTSVTDSYNRQLSFAYGGGKLQTVTTPDGLILTYGYTGAQLTSVGYSTSPLTSQTYLYENAALPSALTGILDENGNRYATWTYDSAGRALSSQLGTGAGLTKVSYNDTDGSRTVTYALGEQIVYKFTILQGVPKETEEDRLASASLPAATRKYTYDNNGYTASQTDWNGNVTSFVNDVHGRPTTVNEAVGAAQARTTTITYHPTFHLPVKVVTPGLTTSFSYDTNGELLTQTLTDTTTTTAPYSTNGQTRTWTYTWSNFLLASVKTPRTDVSGLTKFTYDGSGALTATTNAMGQTTQITQHLPGGLPQTTVDANGVTTSLTYDPRLRLLSRTVATSTGPLATSYQYDAAGNGVGITLPDGSAITNAYDAAHRLTGVIDLFNQSIAYTLDALGDRTQTKVADPSGIVQRMHSGKFDALGRLLQDVGGAGQTPATLTI
jgi:YD repeat-containing protein